MPIKTPSRADKQLPFALVGLVLQVKILLPTLCGNSGVAAMEDAFALVAGKSGTSPLPFFPGNPMCARCVPDAQPYGGNDLPPGRIVLRYPMPETPHAQ